MVILCGSLISMMESQTLSYSSPLYGRRTAQIRLTQIPFRYYREFFPYNERRNLIEMYAVTGGVPKYIESFSNCSDIYQAIQDNVLNQNSYLYDEPNFMISGSNRTDNRKIAANFGNFLLKKKIWLIIEITVLI